MTGTTELNSKSNARSWEHFKADVMRISSLDSIFVLPLSPPGGMDLVEAAEPWIVWDAAAWNSAPEGHQHKLIICRALLMGHQ